MTPYQLFSLAVCAVAFVGLIVFEIFLLIDNKKFYETLDKQRYGCYNKSVKRTKERN